MNLLATSACLSPFVLGSLYFHFRGKLRFSLRRQIGDYSTLLAPYNAFACLRTRGGSKPIHDLAEFPELGILRSHWREIREEALALLSAGEVKAAANEDDLVFYSFMKRGWVRFYLKWYRGFLPSARARCPRTVELLERVPCVNGAMFGLLPPQTRLGKHRDPFAGTLRYHLALSTPGTDDCWMQLDDRRHVWRDGEDILFDSSYVHAAYNRTDQPRLLLFCDVDRPMRDPLSRAINHFVIRHIVPITQVRNTAEDPIGIGNRIFSAMSPLRAGLRALKAHSVLGYRAFKLAAVLAILAALLWL